MNWRYFWALLVGGGAFLVMDGDLLRGIGLSVLVVSALHLAREMLKQGLE